MKVLPLVIKKFFSPDPLTKKYFFFLNVFVVWSNTLPDISQLHATNLLVQAQFETALKCKVYACTRWQYTSQGRIVKGRGQAATIQLQYCQNSLKTHLKYIIITLKVESCPGPLSIFLERARKLVMSRIHLNTDFFRRRREILPPPRKNPVFAFYTSKFGDLSLYH